MSILNKFKSGSAKKIIENFLSLSVLNIVNYIFPLLIIPILIKRMGVENYGIYIFAYTILNYLNLIVQYGFNFSATNKIAKNQGNIDLISQTYSSITIIRLGISFALILLLILLQPIIPDTLSIYLLGSGIFLGQGLIPVWLFQGLEKMKFITIINLIVRVAVFILIYLFIKDGRDMNLLMGFQSISFMLGAIASVFIIHLNFKIKFSIPKAHILILELKEGWQLFLSTIGMNFYRESNIIILGIVTNYTVVGLYAPAEKLIKAFQSFTNIIVTALYPYFSRKFNGKNITAIQSFHKTGRILALIFLLISLFLCLSSPLIIKLYLGQFIDNTVIDLRILSFIILLGGLNYYYGIIGMVNLGMEKKFSVAVWVSGLLSVIICIVLSLFFQDIGAAIAMVVAELVLLFLILKLIKKPI